MEALVVLYVLAIVPSSIILVSMGWLASKAPPTKPTRPTLRVRAALTHPEARRRAPARRRHDSDDDLNLFGDDA